MTSLQQGTLVEATRKTHAGTETLLGTVTMMLIEGETPTHVWVEGTVTHSQVSGLTIPEGHSATWTMPVEPTRWTRLEVL